MLKQSQGGAQHSMLLCTVQFAHMQTLRAILQDTHAMPDLWRKVCAQSMMASAGCWRVRMHAGSCWSMCAVAQVWSSSKCGAVSCSICCTCTGAWADPNSNGPQVRLCSLCWLRRAWLRPVHAQRASAHAGELSSVTACSFQTRG